ncbi:class I SAM-dependent DNA methyltransferase [Paenibacillus koleovorans]|uniref:class I SAM-dependent DNA methyltransferase n=1 Tax=Paenibacillus koleovorans TaxID=121608 RepID=UPI000FDBB3B2|nr:class I SAM-dependent methyltransferase [Paenibacillus koleovorans]
MAYEKFAYAYDQLMEDMPYPQWLRFASQIWEKHGKPATVVDLACGTGNIAIPLAQTGLRVTGIDLSEDMLAVARDKEEQIKKRSSFASGGSLSWIQQDIREWELPRPVDSVLSFCDSLNYLTEPEYIVEAFRSTYAALAEGGSFLFDMHTEAQLKAYAQMQPFVLKEEAISYIWTCDLDEDRCELEHDLTIFVRDEANGAYRRIDELHVQRAYKLDFLEAELYRCGFREVYRYADFKLQPSDDRTERAFFVAIK